MLGIPHVLLYREQSVLRVRNYEGERVDNAAAYVRLGIASRETGVTYVKHDVRMFCKRKRLQNCRGLLT